jgi:flavin reductase (DIM6/NTAB) family NADH-FMN oxidoreductase RutF
MAKRVVYSLMQMMAWSDRRRIATINSLSGFKSATLVGTSSPEHGDNLAVISSIVHLGANPPLMGMILRPPGDDSHTYHNLMSTKVCTFNHK